MKKYFKIILCLFAIMFGVFMFIYGEYDDSPGGQLLGVVLFIIGLVGLLRRRKLKNILNK